MNLISSSILLRRLEAILARASPTFFASGLSAQGRELLRETVTCHLLRADPQCGRVADPRRGSACRASGGRRRMPLRATTRPWLVLAVECWRPARGLSGSAYREPWGPRKGATTSSCCRNVRSSWTVPTCDRTWPVLTLICTWIYCTPRLAETSGYVSCWPLLIYMEELWLSKCSRFLFIFSISSADPRLLFNSFVFTKEGSSVFFQSNWGNLGESG